MRLRLIGLILFLVVVACGGNEATAKRVAVAKSLEGAFNSGDVDAIVTNWTDNGYFAIYEPDSIRYECHGVSKGCWQELIDLGFQWKFSSCETVKSVGKLSCILEIDTGDGKWERCDYIEFDFDVEGSKIREAFTYCPILNKQ